VSGLEAAYAACFTVVSERERVSGIRVRVNQHSSGTMK
jgi:hypothetical protein